MVAVWPVIGDTHTRKTSTIRALTGVRGLETHWLIAYIPGGPSIPTYVQPMGLQERRQPCQNFIADVTASKVDCVIVALRHDAAGHLPDAANYLAEFIAAGWTIPAYAVLGRPGLIPGFPRGIAIPGAGGMASNDVARQVRMSFGIA